MSLYPQNLPLAEALELVSMARNNELATKRAKFAYNLWLLQGFLQRTIVGEPTASSTTADVGVVLTPMAAPADFNAVDELEKLCVAAQNDTITAQVAVPWRQILQWAIAELGTLLLAA